MLVQVELQLLQVRLLGGLDHALELDVGRQGLQELRIGAQLPRGVAAELEEGVLQGVGSVGPPVQQSAGVRPLLLDGGVVQVAAHSQIGQGMGAVVEGHHRLTDPGVAAVELETLVQMVAPHLPGVALHTAAVALRQGVHGLAERGVALEEVDVPALGVQDVGRDAGENIEVGEQPLQLLLVEKDVHGVHPSSSSAPWGERRKGGPLPIGSCCMP